MAKLYDVIDTILSRWRDNKGKGQIMLIPEYGKQYEVASEFVKEITERAIGKNPNVNVGFITMLDVKDYQHANLTVLSPVDLVLKQHFDIVVLYTAAMNTAMLKRIDSLISATFNFVIHEHGSCFINILKLPVLNYSIPKKEFQYHAVNLTESERIAYDTFSEQIKESISKFDVTDDEIQSLPGITSMFDLIEACNSGKRTNTGYQDAYWYRKQLAYLSGWSEDIDISIPYFQDIDEQFSPASIKAASENILTLIRNRKALIKTASNRFKEIIKIITDNPNKKIVIIHENANQAQETYNKLNANSIRNGIIHNSLKGHNIHDELGNWIVDKKGEPKAHGVTTAAKIYSEQFNNCIINVVNVANKPNKNLNLLGIDILIFNGLGIDMKQYLTSKQLQYSMYRVIPIYLFYIADTQEYDKLRRKLKYLNIPINKPRGIFKK